MPAGDCASSCSDSSESCSFGVVAMCRGTPPVARWNNLKTRDMSADLSSERCDAYDALSIALRTQGEGAVEDRTTLCTVAEDVEDTEEAEDDLAEFDIRGDSACDGGATFGYSQQGFAVDVCNRFGVFEREEAQVTIQKPHQILMDSDILPRYAAPAAFDASDLSMRQKPNCDSDAPDQISPRNSAVPNSSGPAVSTDSPAKKTPARKKKSRARRPAAEPQRDPLTDAGDSRSEGPAIAHVSPAMVHGSTAPAGRAPGHKPLVGEKAETLALLTVRLNQQAVKSHLRKACSREVVLATPVDPSQTSCAGMLEMNLGAVVHCEAVDTSGWALGTAVAPARLAGQRGCFPCAGMRPVCAELRGEELECSPATWDRVGQLQPPTTQGRLRQKAMLNKLRLARLEFEKCCSQVHTR